MNETNHNSVFSPCAIQVRMRRTRRLVLAAVLALAMPVQAQTCSGGQGGGTDATGNECNDPTAVGSYAQAAAGGSSVPAISREKVVKRTAASNLSGSGAGAAKQPAVRRSGSVPPTSSGQSTVKAAKPAGPVETSLATAPKSF